MTSSKGGQKKNGNAFGITSAYREGEKPRSALWQREKKKGVVVKWKGGGI